MICLGCFYLLPFTMIEENFETVTFVDALKWLVLNAFIFIMVVCKLSSMLPLLTRKLRGFDFSGWVVC